MESYGVTIQMKATEQYFTVVEEFKFRLWRSVLGDNSRKTDLLN